MKKIAKKYITAILFILARHKLHKIKPKIIGVTGSYGKTTTKEAIFKIFERHFLTEQSQKSFNTPLGMCLTILHQESGENSLWVWLKILLSATKESILPSSYPKYLILEYGADAPGNIEELTALARPDIAVITSVGPVHLGQGQFKNLEAIAEEKAKLLKALPKNGLAILNNDDEKVRVMKYKGKKIFFGQKPDSNLLAKEIKSNLDGTKAILCHKNETKNLVSSVIGRQNISSLLAAISVAVAEKIPLAKAIDNLKFFELPPGRMNLLDGINFSKILDSSYNSSPQTLKSALKTLAEIKSYEKKIAVLGQMNELGKHSKKFHEEIGKEFVKYNFDFLITVFGDAKFIIKSAVEHGFPAENTLACETAEEAGFFLQNIYKLNYGDLVLIKGSQNNVRLEKCVEMLLLNDLRDFKKLCRRNWVK